jgi:putative phosphoesterase
MKIAVLSDTHNAYQTVEKALDVLRDRDIDFVIHCGDIEDRAMVELFRGFTTHFVFGNCDTDRPDLRAIMKKTGATLHEPFGDLELEGRKIAWIHGDNKRLMDDVARSGHFDYLFYGHTHVAREEQLGPTRIINPGALYRCRVKTFLILDPAARTHETITV